MYRASNNRSEWVVEKENDGAWQFTCGGGSEADMKLIANLLNAAQPNVQADAFVVFMRGVIAGLILAFIAVVFAFGSR